MGRLSQYKVVRIQRKYKNWENSRKGEVKGIKGTPLISPGPILIMQAPFLRDVLRGTAGVFPQQYIPLFSFKLEKYNLGHKFTISTILTSLFCDIKYIHIVMQPSPLFIPRTFFYLAKLKLCTH